MTHAHLICDIGDLALTPDELVTHFFLLLRGMEAARSDMRIETHQ